MARSITAKYEPAELDRAQSELALATADWRTTEEYPELHFKARITLTLSDPDAARAQAYDDARREALLQLTLEQERQHHLRGNVLTDADSARIWWLDRHLAQESDLDWNTFKQKILPMVQAGHDAQSKAERAARTLTYVLEQLDSDPARHALFIGTARAVLDQMGWTETGLWSAPQETQQEQERPPPS